jgi:hypothetical protein
MLIATPPHHSPEMIRAVVRLDDASTGAARRVPRLDLGAFPLLNE